MGKNIEMNIEQCRCLTLGECYKTWFLDFVAKQSVLTSDHVFSGSPNQTKIK